MAVYTVFTAEQAPAGSAEALAQVQKKFGFVPNLMGVLAQAPSTLKAYLSLSELLSKSNLSPAEQQVVLLTVSFENDCHYCMAAHSVGAKMAGVPADIVAGLRAGTPLPDAKLQALREFTRKVVQSRARLSDTDVQAFTAAGYDQQNVLEVILGVAMKTISNYTNHFAGTPLDRAFQSEEWHKSA